MTRCINYVAIIPARKNSKRIKNKNLRKLNKKTLFDYTLDASLKSKKITKVLVTSDIKKILKKNTKKIFYIKRPNYLCNDESNTESAINHAVNYYMNKEQVEIKNIVLLQVTSPLRTSKDIDNAIKVFEKGKFNSLFSGYSEKFSLWQEIKKKLTPLSYSLKNRTRHQFMKKTIIENGAIYVFNYKKYLKYRTRLFYPIGCYFMSKDHSVEIDEHEDLKIAEKIINA